MTGLHLAFLSPAPVPSTSLGPLRPHPAGLTPARPVSSPFPDPGPGCSR